MRLLSENDALSLLTTQEAIQASADAYELISTGTTDTPPRGELVQHDPERHALFMPARVGDDLIGFKLLSNLYDRSLPSGVKGVAMVMIVDNQTMDPLGLVSFDTLNDLRTGAGLAAGTRVLSREDSKVLAVFGAGKIAFASVKMICAVRSIERVILVSRTRSKMLALRDRILADPEIEADIDTESSGDDAAEQADIITTLTSSENPVFDGSRVRPGTHLVLAGAFRPDLREVDDAVISRAVIYLDSNEGCRSRAGDIVIPLASGVITEDNIKGEIGSVIAGNVPGRTSSEQITAFKSLGVAAQDVVLAARLLEKGAAAGIGTFFDHIGASIS